MEEDLGPGDLTSELLVPPEQEGAAWIVARQDLVIAGFPLVEMVLRRAGTGLRLQCMVAEGAVAAPGTRLARISGSVLQLLRIERVMLNFLQRCCGVATLTRRFVECCSGSAAVLDTRKTLPGWRAIDKYAVQAGGGRNHRMGLFDGIMIKDNHIAAAGGIGNALRIIKARAPHLVRCEVEADTLAQVREAVAGGADVILLDNMTDEQIQDAVTIIGGRCLVEVSGGIGMERLPRLATLGVDMISAGAITHQAQAVDIGLDYESGELP
ncbi:carboxylating nicotinate-nucleotide diphosphorylase [bacterium]|nr:carboxylating nicotinate-nucleotide diphosphorylase [candidate division CSSED10-310 bacterium]